MERDREEEKKQNKALPNISETEKREENGCWRGSSWTDAAAGSSDHWRDSKIDVGVVAGDGSSMSSLK